MPGPPNDLNSSTGETATRGTCKTMKFNEDSRVKIPAILHLTRLGYTYLSLKQLNYDVTASAKDCSRSEPTQKW